MTTRCIVILLDGLGDRSSPVLGHKTPLQAARTPNLDALAALGANGLFHADRPGVSLPSENAHFSMFGYRQEEFPGRGLLEALGAGIEINPDEVYVLAHFINAEEAGNTLYVKQHRPRVSADEARALVRAVRRYETDDIRFVFRQTKGLDGILALSGMVSPRITDTDPIQVDCPMMSAAPWQSAAGEREAVVTAGALNSYLSWCYRTLGDLAGNRDRQRRNRLPVNAVVTQRAGRWKDVESFSSRWGLRGLSISSGLVFWGLAAFLGLETCKVRDSDEPGADLAGRLDQAFSLAGDYEFIHVHTKAPDVAAHTKDPRRKVEVIEALDRGLAAAVDRAGDGETVLIITSDHSTPSNGPLIHSGEPVPIMVTGPGMRRDQVRHFDEIHCAAGALGQVYGADFMPMVLNFLDMAKLKGLMDTAVDQPYWPGRRSPFRLDNEKGK
ncbi:Phosphoglycerate mutase (2,3-diphosphoglycerate-independent), archaeal type [hydrothermal vent metagenome]|uniref:Phosphoglycerate mutase (2,3-diphosphoglycerate-independent), archaeal type n=1 Tax=hydrothermal vent metagenome TaxID=652676 RepID=A0A3B0V5Q1_9ZZZZ